MKLNDFLRSLSKLRVDRSKGAPAPHKAILLLSIIDSIDSGEILNNRIYITAELVARFKDTWNNLVDTAGFSPNFSLPFFHLKSDKFWQLNTIPGREILVTSSHSIRSFQALKYAVNYASFSEDVYHLLLDSESRSIIRAHILKSYFNVLSTNIYRSPGLFEIISEKLLAEPPSEYKKEIANSNEEDIFVRSGVFKKVVPRIYNYTCCISGMRIDTAREIQMIDACHIIPFAESHDDTITNGISLSPSLHRAFDRFLVTINDNYRVVVSDKFIEQGDHSLKKFHDQEILLPNNQDYRPSTENLQWHYRTFMSLNSV